MANWRIALWAALVVAALAFLYAVRAVLLPFALAYVIAVLLEPLVRQLRLRGLSRGLSVTIVAGAFFVLIGGLLIYSIPRLTGQLGDLRNAFQSFSSVVVQENKSQGHFQRWNPVARAEPPGPIGFIDDTLESITPQLERFGLPSTRRSIYEQYIAPQRDEIADAITKFFNGTVRMIGAAASQMILYLFVPIIVFLFLMDMEQFRLKFLSWIPPTIRAGTVSMIEEIGGVFKNYLRGVTINVLCFTCVVAVVLTLLNVPYSLLMALVIGTIYLIPMIGNFISTVALFVVTGLSGAKGGFLFHTDSPWIFAAVCAGAFVLVSTLYDNIVTPQVVGRSVNLNPLVSMFVIFAGGALFGLPGMLLAFPVAGAVKVTMARLLRLTNQQLPLAEAPLPPSVPLRHRTISDA